MKKLFLLLIVFVWSAGLQAQISINVRMYSNRERLYFGNSHRWMLEHGYHYNSHGYYSGHNRRIYPNRREFYNARNKKWSKHNGYQQTNRKPQRNRGPVKSNNGRERYNHADRKGKR